MDQRLLVVETSMASMAHVTSAISVPPIGGGRLDISPWAGCLRTILFLVVIASACLYEGPRGAFIGSCSLVIVSVLAWLRDAVGWWDTLAFVMSDLLCDLKEGSVTYETELHDAPDGESYAIWWHRRGTRSKRLWVALPGGMSDGSTCCQQSFMRALPPDEDASVFHMPGQGGTTIKERFGPGLCDVTYLLDWLAKLSAQGQYDRVVFVGLSAGGMVLPKLCTASASLPIKLSVRGVMVGSPDFIRHTFEDQSSWMLRTDIFFTIWYYCVTGKSGLRARLPSAWQRMPCRPTWAGYMKPATELAMSLGLDKVRTFEELEEQDFSGFPRARPPLPLLRIHGSNDPIVRPQVLLKQGLDNVEIWWTSRGGHCGQWRSHPHLAADICSWEEQLGWNVRS